MAKSTAIQETATTDIEVRRAEAAAAAAAAMAEMQSTEFDPEAMMVDIMMADSLDAALGDSVLHLKDIIGVPMTVNGATLQESKIASGFLPVYAVMDVVFEDGTTAKVTTGAAQVLAVLVKAQSAKWFPFKCSSAMITSSNGNDVVKLTKV